jgi:CPA2 family monovalent cation:H+ antiporter-2
MSGTLILVAVITSIFTPIAFKKLFPKEVATAPKVRIAFLGANQVTLPVSRELESGLYETSLYHTKMDKLDKLISNSLFDIVEISDYSLETIEKNKIFQTDIIVITTGKDQINADLAVKAKELGVNRVIVRIESPDVEQGLRDKELEVFSSFMSTKTLLRALIETPSVINILTNQETSLYEIRMQNEQYDGMTLRRFPFTGDVIFVRIFRGKDSIVPHGDTELLIHDRLIVTGSKEYVDELKRELEF